MPFKGPFDVVRIDVAGFCLIEHSIFVDLNSARETVGSTGGRGGGERERERLGRIKDVESVGSG